MKQLFNDIKIKTEDIFKRVLFWNNQTMENLDQFNQHDYPLLYVDFSDDNQWLPLPFMVREAVDFKFNLIIRQETYLDIEDKDMYKLVRETINLIMDIESKTEFYDINAIKMISEHKTVNDNNITEHDISFECNIVDYSYNNLGEQVGVTFSLDCTIERK